MKTEYRKNLNKSLMITTLERPELNYELSVLQSNRIEGLLGFEIIAENGSWKIMHDITGQQSLDAWMETEHMDAAFFSELLRSVERLSRSFEPYLLNEDKLCLRPDHIFVRNGSRELSFCFLPEVEKEITDALRELLEYLIARIDHHDEVLVKLAYGAYEKAGESAYRIADLLEEIPEPAEAAEPEPAGEMTECPEMTEAYEELSRRAEQPEKNSFFTELFSFSKNSKKKEALKPTLPSCHEYSGISEDIEDEEPFEEATTFLNPDEDYCKGILKYTGSGKEADLVIEEVPYFVGTRVSVGGRLKSQAVSRLHAKITQAGEVYLLEDLNSTNGTFVNEKPLNYKSPVTLHPKDQVRFADEEFVFL